MTDHSACLLNYFAIAIGFLLIAGAIFLRRSN